MTLDTDTEHPETREIEELGDPEASVRHQRRGQVSVLTLNRPDRLNAVNPDLHLRLRTELLAADADPNTRVIVITGAGKGFCAGGDVQGMEGGNFFGAERRPVRSPGRGLVDTLIKLEKPLIAMVNGVAVGLGATIALSADIVYMAEGARIGDTHVKVGLVAGDGGAVMWPLLIGPSRAKEMLMTGRLLSADEAVRLGLASAVHPADELSDRVFELADELAALPPYAVQATKASVNKILESVSSLVLDTSLGYEHLSMKTEDHKEAVAAFLEKRPGRYTGR